MLTRDKLTVSLIALAQGLLDLISLPIFYFYKDTLNVSAAEISVYISIAMMPWVLKPLFGFLSDQYPILGSRRKSYLLLLTLVETLAIVAIGLYVKTKWELVACQFLQMIGLVFRNVIGGNIW